MVAVDIELSLGVVLIAVELERKASSVHVFCKGYDGRPASKALLVSLQPVA